jgi:hypothetical protein
MLKCVASHIRDVVALMGIPEGDLKIKMYDAPKIKPPRRQTPTENITNRSDYMQNYMKDYREHGKDYQKMPDEIKKRRREQRKKQKEHMKKRNPGRVGSLEDSVLEIQKNGRVMDQLAFDNHCSNKRFSALERYLLLEDLCDLGLILY